MGYAIKTRFAGPTNSRGSRVLGTGPSLTIGGAMVRASVGWDFGAGNPAYEGEPVAYEGRYAGWGDSDANHRRAADAVVAKLRAGGWTVGLADEDRGATLPDESGRVYVLVYGRE